MKSKELLKSLGVDTRGLHKRIDGNTFQYGTDSVWAYTVNTDTNIVEVNKTYFALTKTIKSHNKRMYKKHFKTPKRLYLLIDWGVKKANDMSIHQKVNINLLGQPKLKYLL